MKGKSKYKRERFMIDGKYVSVNGKKIYSIGWFAYDGCHKIYLLQSKKDLDEAMEYYYHIMQILSLKDTYDKSCPLRLITDWKPNGTRYVEQFEDARWEYEEPERKEKGDGDERPEQGLD